MTYQEALLQDKINELVEALKPFASFGPDVAGLSDNQCFMGAAQIKAQHFKLAYKLVQKYVKKTNP